VTKVASVLVSWRQVAHCRCWFGQGGGHEQAGFPCRSMLNIEPQELNISGKGMGSTSWWWWRHIRCKIDRG
jgi:hypothetical protein